MRGIALPSIILSLSVGLLARTTIARATADAPAADQILTELGRLAPDKSKPASRPLAEAKRALSRARSAREAGDTKHAEQLEGLAREWAETARDLLRAAQAEADAMALEQRAAASSVRSERARALLEESIARKGEAEAQLNRQTTPGAQPGIPGPGSRSKPGVAEEGAEPGRDAKTRTPTLAAARVPGAAPTADATEVAGDPSSVTPSTQPSSAPAASAASKPALAAPAASAASKPALAAPAASAASKPALAAPAASAASKPALAAPAASTPSNARRQPAAGVQP